MLHCLRYYWKNNGSNDLKDVLSCGKYLKGSDERADSALWTVPSRLITTWRKLIWRVILIRTTIRVETKASP
jgi:hypothetical protein